MSLKAKQTKDQTVFFCCCSFCLMSRYSFYDPFFSRTRIVVHFMVLCWYDLTFYVYCFWRVYHVIIWHICIDLIRWINIKALPFTEFRSLKGKSQEMEATFPVDVRKPEFEFYLMKNFLRIRISILKTLKPNNFNNKMIPSSKLTLLTKELLIILA